MCYGNGMLIEIWIDGAVGPTNPGPAGGWGAILRYNEKQREFSGGVSEWTTNQRMEILAAIKGLEALQRPSEAIVYSDSQYVVKTMMNGWRRRKNLDLWERLDKVRAAHRVRFQWVKGHSGDVLNERCDELANKALQEHGGAPFRLRSSDSAA